MCWNLEVVGPAKVLGATGTEGALHSALPLHPLSQMHTPATFTYLWVHIFLNMFPVLKANKKLEYH